MNRKYTLIILFFIIMVIGYNKLFTSPSQTKRIAKLDNLLMELIPKNAKTLNSNKEPTPTQKPEEKLPNDDNEYIEPLLKMGNYVMENEIPEIHVSLALEDPAHLSGKIFTDIGTQGVNPYSLDAPFVRGFGLAEPISEGDNQLSIKYQISQSNNKLNLNIITFLYENNEKTSLPVFNITMIHEDDYVDSESRHNESSQTTREPSNDEEDDYPEPYESFDNDGNNSYEFENSTLD